MRVRLVTALLRQDIRSDAELCLALGIPIGRVGCYRTGKNKPSPGALRMLEKFYGVPP